METRISKNLRLLSIGLLIAGVVSVAIALAVPPAQGGRTRRAKGFTIVSKETIKMNDPKMQARPQQADYVMTVRQQKSDGTWKEVITAYKANGTALRETLNFGIPGDASYQLNKSTGELNFLSAMPPKEVTSFVVVSDGHDHPKFVKDDVVQGYKTYVLHYDVDKNGSYMDEYNAPDLDGYPIRTMKVSPAGVSVTEAVEIKLGDPDDSVFASLPKSKVNYEHYKRKMEALDQDGHRQAVDTMRKVLDERLAKERGQK
jgi:hypothetical protein